MLYSIALSRILRQSPRGSPLLPLVRQRSLLILQAVKIRLAIPGVLSLPVQKIANRATVIRSGALSWDRLEWRAAQEHRRQAASPPEEARRRRRRYWGPSGL